MARRDSWDWGASMGTPTCVLQSRVKCQRPLMSNEHQSVPSLASIPMALHSWQQQKAIFPMALHGTKGWEWLRQAWNSLCHLALPSSSYTNFSHALYLQHLLPSIDTFLSFPNPLDFDLLTTLSVLKIYRLKIIKPSKEALSNTSVTSHMWLF